MIDTSGNKPSADASESLQDLEDFLEGSASAVSSDVPDYDYVACALDAWRSGFIAWWPSEDEFKQWCIRGLPDPLGSFPLEGTKQLRLTGTEGQLQFYQTSSHEVSDFHLTFDSTEDAQRFADHFDDVKHWLGQPLYWPDKSREKEVLSDFGSTDSDPLADPDD